MAEDFPTKPLDESIIFNKRTDKIDNTSDVTKSNPGNPIGNKIKTLQDSNANVLNRQNDVEAKVAVLETVSGFPGGVANVPEMSDEVFPDSDSLLVIDASTNLVKKFYFSQLENFIVEKFIPHIADTTVGVSSQIIIPADSSRNSLEIINVSTTDAVLIGFGSPPIEGETNTLLLPPSGGYEKRYPRKDAIYARAKSNSISLFANYTNTTGIDVVANMLADQYLARGSGGASVQERAAVRQLVSRLRESGAYFNFRAAAILANIDTVTAAQDLVRDIAWSRFNTPTFTKYQGYRGNGTNSYISTNYVPNADTEHFSAASHSFGAYVDNTLQGSAGTPTTMGSTTTGISANRSNNQATMRSATTSSNLIEVGGRGGLFALSRTKEASYRAIYKQTAQEVPTPISENGLGIVPYEMFVLAQNSSATGAVQFSTVEVAFAFAGEPQTDEQLFSIDTAVAEYKVALAAIGN